MSDTKEVTKTLEEILDNAGIEPSNDKVYKLILWNDDFNSFDHVILCLISIMKFSPEKAEKTAWTVHIKGACLLKSGSKDKLSPYKSALEYQGLTLTIEKD